MGREIDLLRMLEPAVRPGAVPGMAQPAAREQPIEERSFDSLLEEARSLNVSSAPEPEAHTPAGTKKAGPLAELAGLDRIENAALRTLLTRPAGNDQA